MPIERLQIAEFLCPQSLVPSFLHSRRPCDEDTLHGSLTELRRYPKGSRCRPSPLGERFETGAMHNCQ